MSLAGIEGTGCKVQGSGHRIEDMKSIQVAFYKEGKHWVAQELNVEVSSFGDTLEEAKAAIREALELYFEG